MTTEALDCSNLHTGGPSSSPTMMSLSGTPAHVIQGLWACPTCTNVIHLVISRVQGNLFKLVHLDHLEKLAVGLPLKCRLVLIVR